jgi:transcriptional regulator with PAS, ATPase and Fis domain
VGLADLTGDLPDNAKVAQFLRTAGQFTQWIALTPNNVDDLPLMRIIAQHFHSIYTLPLRLDGFLSALRHSQQMSALKARLFDAQAPTGADLGIIGQSGCITTLRHTIHKYAIADESVLITGESGTGKELVARAIHALSPRRHGPFITINCAALPGTLIQSELFGCERGAFTGADSRRIGLIECAHHGTLFLDGLGELDPRLQVYLLRALETKRIQRLGGNEDIAVDIRTISATSADLESAIQNGTFRADLFFRLNVLHLDVPPLRSRPEDIRTLAHHFLDIMSTQIVTTAFGFHESALAAMDSYAWPGNVREMMNRIRVAMIKSEGTLLTAQDLGLGNDISAQPLPPLNDVRLAAEKGAVRDALARAGWNISAAARALGITRATLYRLIDKLELTPDPR